MAETLNPIKNKELTIEEQLQQLRENKAKITEAKTNLKEELRKEDITFDTQEEIETLKRRIEKLKEAYKKEANKRRESDPIKMQKLKDLLRKHEEASAECDEQEELIATIREKYFEEPKQINNKENNEEPEQANEEIPQEKTQHNIKENKTETKPKRRNIFKTIGKGIKGLLSKIASIGKNKNKKELTERNEEAEEQLNLTENEEFEKLAELKTKMQEREKEFLEFRDEYDNELGITKIKEEVIKRINGIQEEINEKEEYVAKMDAAMPEDKKTEVTKMREDLNRLNEQEKNIDEQIAKLETEIETQKATGEETSKENEEPEIT